MSFVSVSFVLFLLGTVFAYYILPKKCQWIILLVASVLFYWIGGGKTVAYMGFTALSVWAGGLWLYRLNCCAKEADSADEKKKLTAKRKWIVAAVLIANFGMLYCLKYLDLTFAAAESFVGRFLPGWTAPRFELILPLGVSFFIFQSAGYLLDQFRGKYPPQRNFFRFALFVSFFPQIVQGPISRYRELGEQLNTEHPLDFENFRMGILQILWGYFKKLVIADRASVLVNAFFADTGAFGGAVTAVTILVYCIELYCDFSGGIDITVGVAKLFDIELAENFRRPIFALSLAEYWRRWHITLGTWMRDYLFYPLALSKPFASIGKKARKVIKGRAGKVIATSLATFVVYLVIGIWHGANFKYIIYGLWNGTIITLSLLMEGKYILWKNRLHIRDESSVWKAFQMLRTMFIVFIGRYITRAPRFAVAVSLIGRTFNIHTVHLHELWSGRLLEMGLGVKDFFVIALGLVVLMAVETYQEKRGSVRDALAKKNGWVQWSAMVALMLAVLCFGILRDSYIASGFIYQQY